VPPLPATTAHASTAVRALAQGAQQPDIRWASVNTGRVPRTGRCSLRLSTVNPILELRSEPEHVSDLTGPPAGRQNGRCRRERVHAGDAHVLVGRKYLRGRRRRLKRPAVSDEKSELRAEFSPPLRLSDVAVAFDCETGADEIQGLTFAFCRIYQGDRMRLEILIHADDQPLRDGDGYAELQRYVASVQSDAPSELGTRRKPIVLMSCTEFLETVFYPLAYRGHALVVGFNLPFDLTRIARRAAPTKQHDGFSLSLWENPNRPRLSVRITDSKRAGIRFTKRNAFEGESGYDASFPGHFLDLRTLAFALTDRSYSLASACKEFEATEQKSKAEGYGAISEKFIDYCRQDVCATGALWENLRERYSKHPIDLPPTKARSAASIGKAYYRAMHIPPTLARHPSFNREHLGQAMVAYFGGRVECRIRRWPVPVVYVDFTSMYTSVNSLIGIWKYLIAKEIAVEEWAKEARAFIDGASIETMLDKSNWPALVSFVEVQPDGADVLPVRAQYQNKGNYQIGVNYFESSRPLWYTLADAIASKLLTGKSPRVLRAWRIVPHGILPDLRSISLDGEIPVDPAQEDLFRVVIEQRNRLPDKRSPTGTFLKVLANSSAYGIFVELNPERLGENEAAEVIVHGTREFRTRVARPEIPGKYCFPPIGATITGAARLMLMLLECLVRDAGGTFAFCDTDSMAIVATEHGGLVPCPGGPEHMPDGAEAVQGLSWAQVHEIRERLSALCPYDPSAVRPIDLLKLEDVNFGKDGSRRQLYAFSIASKRYARYVLDANGEPIIVDAKARGLGHLLSPNGKQVTDSDGDDDHEKLRPWMRELWLMLVREALGLPVTEPAWLDQPAMSRITVSQPAILKRFAERNAGYEYADQIKPCNFLIAPHIAHFGHPVGVDREHFALIAPFESDSDCWLDLEYFDRYSGRRFHISCSIAMPTEDTARVQTFRDVVNDYRRHPEAKFNAPDGKPCRVGTVGLLSRRHVLMDGLPHFIGKESNELEAREYGQVADLDEVQTEYGDEDEQRRAKILALMDAKGVAGAARERGVSERTVRRWLSVSS
jgi:DNA polymerase type B, organellar and viral